MATPDLLQTAVRAFTLRTTKAPPLDPDPEDLDPENGESEPARSRRPRRSYAREALVWDTETVTTPDQRLMVLCWRVYDLSLGEPACIEEGFAYPDDLEQWDPEGFVTLTEYAAGHEWAARPGVSRMPGGRTILLVPLSWWLEKRLYRLGYDHRHRCDVVGFNLPFDFGRVAAYWGAGEDRFYGGWSLGLSGRFDHAGRWRDRRHKRRLRLKSIDPRRSLIAWGSQTRRSDTDERPVDWWKGVGRFVDLRTLAFALTDKGHSLESACRAFAVPYTKQDVEHGKITPKLLTYAREDVAATANLYFACRAELDRHEGIALQAHKLYSPATIGANYLKAMGYRPPLEKFTEIEPWQLGWETDPATATRPQRKSGPKHGQTDWPALLGQSMCAFYGGRAEARIVRTPVPVALVDFTSMYPSVNALLDTRSLLNAELIKTTNVTETIQALLGSQNLVDRCYDPVFWRDQIGVTLVEIEPDGDILPIRAHYDPTGGDLGIGVNPYHLDRPVWYALPDVIAATILTGRPPRVTQAMRLVGEGEQEGLRPVKLRGGLELDPRIRDPFITMIEERQRVRKDATIPDDEREWRQLFLKVTANSTAYGVLARFDRKERATPIDVAAYGPDPDPIPAKTKSPEDPAPIVSRRSPPPSPPRRGSCSPYSNTPSPATAAPTRFATPTAWPSSPAPPTTPSPAQMQTPQTSSTRSHRGRCMRSSTGSEPQPVRPELVPDRRGKSNTKASNTNSGAMPSAPNATPSTTQRPTAVSTWSPSPTTPKTTPHPKQTHPPPTTRSQTGQNTASVSTSTRPPPTPTKAPAMMTGAASGYDKPGNGSSPTPWATALRYRIGVRATRSHASPSQAHEPSTGSRATTPPATAQTKSDPAASD